MEIEADLKRFTCFNCKKTYCPQCNNDHPIKIPCENFQNLKQQEIENEKKKAQNNYANKNLPKNNVAAQRSVSVGLQKKQEQKKNNEKIAEKQPEKQPEKKNAAETQAEKKKREEALTLEFLNNNCKKCPKCKTPIEKESGCNFMKCRWPACKDSYFCLLCEKALTVKII